MDTKYSRQGGGGWGLDGVRRISTRIFLVVFKLLSFLIYTYSNDRKNALLSNVVVAETPEGSPIGEEARKGDILRIHAHRER